MEEGEGGVGEGENRVWTREVETGSSDREGNMLRFAVEGLRLVADVINGGAGEGSVIEEKKEGARM